MGESEAAKIKRLIRDGLDRFGTGDASQAIACWDEVLAIDPQNAKALDYLEAARGDGETHPSDAGRGDAGNQGPEREVTRLLEEAQNLLGNDDLEGALSVFRAAANRDPDRIEIESYIDMVRGRLVRRYRDRVGDTGAAPRMVIDPSELTAFDLPADAGFMLSLVDGKTSIDELIALSGMDTFEALRILNELVAAGIAELES